MCLCLLDIPIDARDAAPQEFGPRARQVQGKHARQISMIFAILRKSVDEMGVFTTPGNKLNARRVGYSEKGSGQQWILNVGNAFHRQEFWREQSRCSLLGNRGGGGSAPAWRCSTSRCEASFETV